MWDAIKKLWREYKEKEGDNDVFESEDEAALKTIQEAQNIEAQNIEAQEDDVGGLVLGINLIFVPVMVCGTAMWYYYVHDE